MNGCLRRFQPVMNARIRLVRSRTEVKVPRVLAAAGLISGPADRVAELARLFRTDVPAFCVTGF